MNIYYNLFIFYIFSIKILFVLFSTTEMYYQWKNKKLEKTEKIENIKNEEYAKNLQLHRTEIKLGRFASPEFLSVGDLSEKENEFVSFFFPDGVITDLDYWKKRFEFIYIMCMSILLIYLFYPYQKTLPLITKETRYLIFLFAFILITTANWSLFFQEPSLFIELQKSIGREK